MIEKLVETLILAAVCEFETKLMRSSYNTPRGRYALVMARIPTFHMNSEFVRNANKWLAIVEALRRHHHTVGALKSIYTERLMLS